MSLLKPKTLVPAALLSASLLSLAAAARADDAATLDKLFAQPLQTVYRWSEIPPDIRKLVSAPWHGESIADPGQPFQVSDAVVDPNLPWRRLIFAAHAANVWIVYYERGGIEHSFHLAVVPFHGKDVAYFGVMPPLGKEDYSLQRLRALAAKSGGIWASEAG